MTGNSKFRGDPSVLAPLLFSITLLAQADTRYSNVYIFGDSLSDTGNLASVLGPLPNPPYFNNRITNGSVAVETLAAKLGDIAAASLHLLGMNSGHNYSVAGARAATNDILDLNTQIISFQANHGFIADSNDLYVIFLGGNDLRDAVNAIDKASSTSIIKTANINIKNTINNLTQIGARSFLVINAPNIALIPETQLIANATGDIDRIKRASKLSKKFNKQLHKTVKKLKHKNVINITEFNLSKLFTKIVKKTSELGFTNNTDACFSSVTSNFHPDCNFGLNIEKFVFFDEIHPTARVHALFGEAFYKKLIHNKKHKDKYEGSDDLN